MTHALPAAPAAPPRRQVFIGTAIASVAALMLTGGMLALFLLHRQRWLAENDSWLPQGVEISGVATNIALLGMLVTPVFAQWAVYAARRHDRLHLGLALGLVVIIGIAAINAQSYLYQQMGLGVADSGYAGMFYAITGTVTALIIIGVVYSAVVMFRLLGGRQSDTELVAAHALYWYVLAAIYSALWLIVYVTK